MGNLQDGILVASDGATIGGLAAGAGNIIANNGASQAASGESGVQLTTITTSGIPILSNSIYNNQPPGDQPGQTAPRAISSFPPTIASASTTGASSTIRGTLNATVGNTFSGTYTLQFFSTPTLNPSGNTEGETLIGTVTLNLSGSSYIFTEVLPTAFTPGSLISATLTDSLGNTSQFSQGILGTQGPPTISVQASAPSVPIGQPVTDTFTITNPATIVADEGVIFSDAIPAGTTFISGMTSTGAPVLVSNGVASADIGTLAAVATVTVMIVLSPTLAAEPSFTNTGDVTATTPPISSGTVTASVTTDVLPTADMSVTITGPSGPVDVGQSFVYTVTATNNGPSPATGIILTDSLPGTVTFVSATSSSGQVPTESMGTVTDSVPTLAAGATEVLTITVIPTAAAPPSVSDTASVSANEFDPNLLNNVFTLGTTVNPVADLAITGETITPSPVAIGNEVTITIAVANNGPSTATDVFVDDVLPAGLTFLFGTAAGGTVGLVNGEVSAPVGTLLDGAMSLVTIVAVTTMTGTFTDNSVVSGAVSDPDMTNNTGSATVVVTPLADVSVVLSGTAGPIFTGDVLAYTAIVTNNGPSPATNVLFADPLFAGASFVGIEANGVAGSVVNGVAEQPLGTLAAGASVTVLLLVIPTMPGVVTDTAMVAATEPDPNLANNSSSVTTTLVTPMSLITFSTPTYEVANNAGFAAITLVRAGFEEDDVTVHFSTVGGGNAVPGVDYEPVSEIVDFPAGSTQETVFVPVLDDAFENHNDVLNLQLDTPTGSGVLEPNPTNATLLIVDVNPDLVGPTVTALKLTGYVNSITSIEIDTTGGLDPATANNPLNYTITAFGGVKGGLPFATVVPVASAIYDPAKGAVFLIPSQPLPANELFLIDVNGSRPGAVADLAGNTLNSVAGVKPGSDYLLTVARGTDIVYPNENGEPVTLKLSGPGTIDIDRFVAGDLEILQVVGGVANKTVITGTVHPTLQRSKIGTILGIGQFGSIRVKMTTPPFYVANTVYPNLETQVDAPAIDTLLPPPPAPPKPVKTKVVKAKAIESTSKTVHAAAVHVAKVKVAKEHAPEAHKPPARHHG